MKVQMRYGVYETNSSSVHTLSIFNTDEWNKFKLGEMVMKEFPYAPTLVNKSDKDSTETEYDDEYTTYEELKSNKSYYDIIFENTENHTIMSLYGDN